MEALAPQSLIAWAFCLEARLRALQPRMAALWMSAHHLFKARAFRLGHGLCLKICLLGYGHSG